MKIDVPIDSELERRGGPRKVIEREQREDIFRFAGGSGRKLSQIGPKDYF